MWVLGFFLLTVKLWKGFPVTQADFLKHRSLITLPCSVGLQEHMQNLCEGHCLCHVEQVWWKGGFPWALCTEQRNHFGLGFCFLFVQTIVVFVETYHLKQKNKKVVSGGAGINQNPIAEGLLWAGNARKEWPGICLCWGQHCCKLHHILGKTFTVCLCGACILLSHFLPVSLYLSSTEISAARSLSCACAGMLLRFWWFLQTLSYLCCSKAFCSLGSALIRMTDDKCLCHQMRFHTEILGGILHIITYLSSQSNSGEAPSVLSANCWGIHLYALTLGRVMGCLWRK